MLNKIIKYERLANCDDIEVVETFIRNENEQIEINLDNNFYRNNRDCVNQNKINISKKLIFKTALVVLILAVIALLIVSLVENRSSDELNHNYRDWELNLSSLLTKSFVKVFDLDKDGLNDMIISLSKSTNFQGLIKGIRGKDGTIIYQFSTRGWVFGLNCHSIDIDLDGKTDCIATGQNRTLFSFNPRNGTILWEGHGHGLNDRFNIYPPVILPYDLDNDGVFEFVISHGGNSNSDQESGLIILYSGQTGKALGECLPLPFNKQTNISPILHTLSNGASYLLMGSGDNTIFGEFYIIYLPDFLKHVLSDDLIYNRLKLPEFSGDNLLKKYLEVKFQSVNYLPALYSIYSTKFKGLMVQPVLADINNDGTEDILVISFDGNISLFSGTTLNVIWSKSYNLYQTTIKVFLAYFNDDNTLDFILFQNHLKVLVLNGKDGSVLDEFESEQIEIISQLEEQPLKKEFNIIRFKDDENSIKNKQHCLGIQSIKEHKRSSQMLDNGNSFSTNGFIVERSSQNASLIYFKSNEKITSKSDGLNDKKFCVSLEVLESSKLISLY